MKPLNTYTSQQAESWLLNNITCRVATLGICFEILTSEQLLLKWQVHGWNLSTGLQRAQESWILQIIKEEDADCEQSAHEPTLS
jgi:hypothetical protein